MATTQQHTGYIDSLHVAKLSFINGVSHPAAPAGTYLAVYGGSLPDSTGTGGTEITGTRPAVTFGSAQQDAGGRYYIANTAPITVTLTNASAAQVTGFGVCGAATGGTPNYVGRLYPQQVTNAATVTFPIGSIRVYAEGSGN